MLKNKDRKIANQKIMISNRDKLIKYQEEKIEKLEAKIMQIRVISGMNKYNHPEIYLRRINEIVNKI